MSEEVVRSGWRFEPSGMYCHASITVGDQHIIMRYSEADYPPVSDEQRLMAWQQGYRYVWWVQVHGDLFLPCASGYAPDHRHAEFFAEQTAAMYLPLIQQIARRDS